MRDISRFQVTCVVTSCASVAEPMTSAMSAAESSSRREAVAGTPIPPLLPRMRRADNRTANIDRAADSWIRRTFFRDGRMPSLEEQVLKPIQDPNEMDLTLEEASARVKLDLPTLSRALASYIRRVLSADLFIAP